MGVTDVVVWLRATDTGLPALRRVTAMRRSTEATKNPRGGCKSVSFFGGPEHGRCPPAISYPRHLTRAMSAGDALWTTAQVKAVDGRRVPRAATCFGQAVRIFKRLVCQYVTGSRP